MGLFGKTIKCSYCNKSVKESYAMDVGICPHCGKRLVLGSRSTSFDDCQHSDGSSHKGYSYESNSFINDTNSSTYKSTSSSATNATTSTTNTTTTRIQPDSANNINNAKPTNTNSYGTPSNRRPAIDTDYVRQINEEANGPNSFGGRPTVNYNRPSYSARPSSSSRNGYTKEASKKTTKIIRRVFIVFFVIQFIIPFIFGIGSLIFFSDHYDDTTEDFYDEYYDDLYNNDMSGDIYDDKQDFPSSQIMEMYLPLYFDKDFHDITQEDLEYIRGISITYNEQLQRLYIYIYNADNKSYKEFLHNDYLNVNSIMNQRGTFRKGTFEVAELDLDICISELMEDMNCFTNLEYIYMDQEMPSHVTFSKCPYLTAFIAPEVILDSNIFADANAIEYLSIYEISNTETAEAFTNLKAFAYQDKYYMQDALDVLYSNNPYMTELTHINVSDSFS